MALFALAAWQAPRLLGVRGDVPATALGSEPLPGPRQVRLERRNARAESTHLTDRWVSFVRSVHRVEVDPAQVATAYFAALTGADDGFGGQEDEREAVTLGATGSVMFRESVGLEPMSWRDSVLWAESERTELAGAEAGSLLSAR